MWNIGDVISYKSYVLVVCCTGQSAIPGPVEQKSNNECAVAKKTVGNVMYGVTFLFLSLFSLYDPLGSDRAWVLGLKCERLGLNLYTGRREGNMCVLMDCV